MAGFFFNEEFSSPDAIDRRRALVNALSKENLSAAPVQHWTQALARVLGAAGDQYETAKLNEAEKKSVETNKAALLAAFGGSGMPSASTAPMTQTPSPAPASAAPPPPAASNPPPAWAGGLGNTSLTGFAPAPSAPPAADGRPPDQELAIRTIAAETSGNPQETQAIAAVIANRLKSGKWGNNLGDVVLAQNQFEPWNGGPGSRNDPMKIDPASPRYQAASAALAAALQGTDPTNGATHFFAPGAQAALGRQAPAWGREGGQQIGATTFFAPEGRAAPGAVLNSPVAPAAAPAPAPAPAQGGVQRPAVNPALLAALSSPWAAKNPMLAQLGAKIASDQLTGTQFGFQVVGDQMYRTNPRTGQVEPVGVSAQKPLIIPEGGTLFDPNSGKVLAAGGNKDTPDLKNYQEAVRGGFKGSFTDYQIALRRATSAQPESTFNTEVAKGQAKEFGEMAGELPNAKTDIANIKSLRAQLDQLPGGFLGNAQAAAVRLGIKIGPNVSAVEAADAILNRLTPAQRQGMPGAASDRDVQMFRAALPSLGQSKEGQKIIMDTMEGLAQYKLAQAQIAQQARTGKIKPEQAMEQLAAIPDPFEQYKKIRDQLPAQGAPATPPAGPKPGDVMQGYRFKGGNPADRNSWEKV